VNCRFHNAGNFSRNNINDDKTTSTTSQDTLSKALGLEKLALYTYNKASRIYLDEDGRLAGHNSASLAVLRCRKRFGSDEEATIIYTHRRSSSCHMFAVAVSELANQILLARALLFFGYTERGREGGREGDHRWQGRKEGRREGRAPQTRVQKQSAVHLRPASDVHGTAQEDAGYHEKQVSASKDVRTSVDPGYFFWGGGGFNDRRIGFFLGGVFLGDHTWLSISLPNSWGGGPNRLSKKDHN
jgi:hypothetical protein